MSELRQVNFEGNKNLASQAASAGVRSFIFLSSIKVYGKFCQIFRTKL
jgi:UDP-glucose 4-epimerase